MGLALKHYLWMAENAIIVTKFEDEMRHLKDLHEKAWGWIYEKDPMSWFTPL